MEGISVYFLEIYPYAFYPFYLFIFDGNLVSAIPFLAFVSGWQADTRKDVTDLKASGLPGWAVSDLHKRYLPRSGHFFSQAKRKRFLETLYLKLNFLFQTAKQLMTAEDALFLTSNSQYLERIWVRLPETSGDLPNFWNFTVHILDLSTNPLPNEQLPGWSSNHLRQILGRLWFYVLLTNSRQSMRAVWSELQTMLIQARSDGTSLTTMYRTRSAEPVFSYQNIYWNTEGPVCRPELWKQSLILGLRLLEVDSNLGTVFTATDFFSKFHALIEKVNHSLLGIERGRDGEEVDSISQDDAIIKVLRAILMDWEREELDAKSVGPTGVQHSAFSRQATKPTPEYMVRKKFRKDGREDLPGTIIAASKKNVIHPLSTVTGADDETLILQPEETKGIGLQTAPPTDDGLIEETVVLRAHEDNRGSGGLEAERNLFYEGDEPETIIVSSKNYPPGKGRIGKHGLKIGDHMTSETATKQKSNKKMEDKTLMKTVILRPVSEKRGDIDDG